MKDFKKFGEGHMMAGNRDYDPKEGAMVCFDAWVKSKGWSFRVWHYNPELEINLEGEGYEVVARKRKFHDDLGFDEPDYCTYIDIAPTSNDGWVEVKTPTEHQWEDAKVSWGGGHIKDFWGNKADLELDFSGKEVEIRVKEVLSKSDKRHFMMEDRLFRLRKVAESQGNSDMITEIMSCRREFMSSAQADDYEAWLDETYGVCPNK